MFWLGLMAWACSTVTTRKSKITNTVRLHNDGQATLAVPDSYFNKSRYKTTIFQTFFRSPPCSFDQWCLVCIFVPCCWHLRPKWGRLAISPFLLQPALRREPQCPAINNPLNTIVRLPDYSLRLHLHAQIWQTNPRLSSALIYYALVLVCNVIVNSCFHMFYYLFHWTGIRRLKSVEKVLCVYSYYSIYHGSLWRVMLRADYH